jgi:hypothetical protein
MNKNATKIAAGAAAVVAIGIGAAAVGSASSSDNRTQNASFGGPPGASGQTPPSMNGTQQQGQQAPPGFGTEATGSDAEKAKNAALKKYPGTAEKVMKLQDGSYVVHVITDEGELHVAVDADFNVTGTETGGPGGRGGPPPGGMIPPGSGSGNGQVPQPPSGAQPPSGSGSGSTT